MELNCLERFFAVGANRRQIVLAGMDCARLTAAGLDGRIQHDNDRLTLLGQIAKVWSPTVENADFRTEDGLERLRRRGCAVDGDPINRSASGTLK